MNLADVKLKGRNGAHGRDYTATYQGGVYDIFRGNKSGTFYLLAGQRYDTINDCKRAIISGDTTDETEPAHDEDTVLDESPRESDLWDCKDPCALLAKAYGYVVRSDGPHAGDLAKDILETLDNHGWCCPLGTIDLQRADRMLNGESRMTAPPPRKSIV